MTQSKKSNLDNFDWLDKADHAEKYFRLKFPRYKNLAKDFSQWCILKWLEGYYLTVEDTFFYMGLDFLKREHRHQFNRVDLDKTQKLSGTDQVFESELKNTLTQLEGRDRAIFALCYKWDFTNEEIAECFGMTPNAVGQKLFNIRNDIKKQNKYG